MAIQRWDPVQDLVRLRERLNSMFEEALARSGAPREPGGGEGGGWRPPTDLFEEPARWVARVDLPGIAPADVEIEVDGGKLRVRGERRMDLGVPREAYLRSERPQGAFELVLALPDAVDRDAIRAHHKDGVLEIDLPRRKDAPASRVRVDAK